MRRWMMAVVAASMIALGLSGPALAASCTGNCGELIANGVVNAPPNGQASYHWVSTYRDPITPSVDGAGEIDGIGGSNGSEFLTSVFTASAGDTLNYLFDYVTTDSIDYAFAELLTSSGVHVAWLFTAATNGNDPSNTVPGAGLPTVDATLTPSSAGVTTATTWAPLGPNDPDLGEPGVGGGGSGDCSFDGCGNTGWIASTYDILSSGDYMIRVGVTNQYLDGNYDDTYQTGLAFSGTLTTNGGTIDPNAVPEPAAWAMMVLGFGLSGSLLRRERAKRQIA